jgi:SAM-dependent methyltransferase
MYDEITQSLRESYDRNVEERDQTPIAPWKIEERGKFLQLLQAEAKTTLLEIGAGPGRDSLYFHENGLQVVSTDLSPGMVKRCREKGLTAYVMDFLHLDFPPASFDAVYALNSLLHVPKADLPHVLKAIQKLLKPNGLFYFGVFGGENREGVLAQDRLEPKRFFASYSDEAMVQAVSPFFDVVYFGHISLERENEHFQSMILRTK